MVERDLTENIELYALLWRRAVRLTVGLALAIMMAHPATAAEVWLAGGLPSASREAQDPTLTKTNDFLALFGASASWSTAAKTVRVIQVNTPFLERGSDAALTAAFADMKARGIAFGVEIGLLSGDGSCGKGMEGFAAPRTAEVLATRAKRLGGEIAFVAMDEPLWYGRYANGPTACHWDIPTIVAHVAEHVAELHAVFPNVKVGDIEPIGVPASLPWTQEIEQFAAAFRTATGTPLAFLHSDIQWSHGWQPQLKALAHIAHISHIPLGVIVNSDRPERSDTDWTTHAEAGLVSVRSVLGGLPDQLIFQSWTPNPRHFLPENEPGTMTNLIARFHGR